MNVKVQVRHFLVCARPSGVPDAQAVSRKGCIDGTCDARDHNEDGGGRLIVGTANIADMRPRDDEDMSWMELSQVKKRNGKRILRHDRSGQSAGDHVAERTDAKCIATVHSQCVVVGHMA
jgi:hypothetical protein